MTGSALHTKVLSRDDFELSLTTGRQKILELYESPDMDESDVLKKSISKIQTSLFLLIKSFSLQHQEIESDKKMITDMKQIFGRELNDSCIISAIHVLSISDLLDVLNQHKNTDKLEKFNNKLAFLKPFFGIDPTITLTNKNITKYCTPEVFIPCTSKEVQNIYRKLLKIQNQLQFIEEKTFKELAKKFLTEISMKQYLEKKKEKDTNLAKSNPNLVKNNPSFHILEETSDGASKIQPIKHKADSCDRGIKQHFVISSQEAIMVENTKKKNSIQNYLHVAGKNDFSMLIMAKDLCEKRDNEELLSSEDAQRVADILQDIHQRLECIEKRLSLSSSPQVKSVPKLPPLPRVSKYDVNPKTGRLRSEEFA